MTVAQSVAKSLPATGFPPPPPLIPHLISLGFAAHTLKKLLSGLAALIADHADAAVRAGAEPAAQSVPAPAQLQRADASARLDAIAAGGQLQREQQRTGTLRIVSRRAVPLPRRKPPVVAAG